MLFNSRKYIEETEHNRIKHSQDPSMFELISLGTLASFPPSRFLLRLHPNKITSYSNYKIEPFTCQQTPILYINGFRGGDYTTRVLVKEAGKAKHNPHYLKVTCDAVGNFTLEGTWTGDQYPIVQLVFRHRIAGMSAISYYLSRILPFLKKQFKFDTYFAVAHSLGAPAIVATAMHYFKHKNFPTLKKAALIAGPFDGVTYLGDIPNVNYLGEKGRPIAMNLTYLKFILGKKRICPDASVLNIYGNILDETNTDKFISVVSAKSIRYILAPQLKFYQEVEIRGTNAEHSWLHDDPFVNNIINRFLGLK